MAKKPTVTTLQSGFNSTEVLNENFENIRDAFDNTLSLDGSTPNAMQADLDLNGNNLIGATGLLINGTDYLADVEAAKSAALVAQAAAELAENNAETAEVNSEAYETDAGLSATAAATSATDALTSRGAAEIARTGAETAETGAAASAVTAASEAATATTKASEASASAAAAAASEAGVDADRVAAQAAASAAASSETNAATSAANAATSLTNTIAAELSAIQASADADTAKNTAITSATNAATSEANAATSASTATTQATNAATSASAASASATNAATSETNAATSEANALSYVADSESARDQSQAARDTTNLHKLAAEAAATSATNTAAALTGFDLEAIAASKAVTAVDVFVYDTSKDSDGGAWRKRTQGTSWYNETLNTATRGSRREFPAVAVIVAEASKVTIYDGDDPSLPMWMVFEGGLTNFLYDDSNRNVSSLAAINAVVSVGQDGTGGGLRVIRFLDDLMDAHLAEAKARLGSNSLSLRNSDVQVYTASGSSIVNRTVNDVAMTVLPNAPIDPATGLPVPTIAVATNGGVSVIKDDGTVADTTVGFTPVVGISFDEENGLYWSRFNSDYLSYATPDDYVAGDGFGDRIASSTIGAEEFNLLTDARSGFPVAAQNSVFENGTNGLAIHSINTSDFTKGMSALTTSTYNTGWMNGDIKGAFLSDTDDTDLVGAELVTNGTFDTDVSGWNVVGGTASHDTGGDGGRLLLTDDSSTGNVRCGRSIGVISAGQTVVATVDYVLGSSNTAYLRLSANGVSGTVLTQVLGGDASGKITLTYTSPIEQTIFVVLVGSAADGQDVYFDNASVKLADADRSVNNNGLVINGTVTRSPVATGADLVAYSGFSASNYLEQPYNSDLDFGTGDACYMGWVKPSDNGWYFVRGPEGVNDPLGLRQLNGTLTASIGGASLSGGSIPDGVWAHVALIRKSGVAYIYANGEEVASISATASLDGSDYILRLGIKVSSLGNNFIGSLALWRISATAPSPEQIAKIYEDEKVLFQENAQATLYGTSDAVTALAHDDATNLLHVGTSAGRSVFQGLRRVDNTTTAVGTAISAANNLVVEE